MFGLKLRHSITTIAATLAIFGAARIADASTYYVSTCGNDTWFGVQPGCAAPLGPKRTIQAAINVAVDGDSVLVLPGTYVETIDLQGKAISVIGTGPAGDIVIDSNGDAPVVSCTSGEGPDTVLENLFLTGADTTIDGGGVLNVFSSPTFIECIIYSNYTTGNGAGMANFLASPTLIDCNIVFNEAGAAPPDAGKGYGAGIYSVSSNVTITGAFMQTCYAKGRGGLMAFLNSTATISNCDFYTSGSTFDYGSGAGIYLDGSDITVNDCYFQGVNIFSPDGEGGALMALNGSQIECSGTTFTSAIGGERGGAALLIDSAGNFVDCEFENLIADVGGALHVDGGNCTLALCSFLDMSAAESGGAAAFVGAQVELDTCVFMANDAIDGAAIYSNNSLVTVDDCGFTDNAASNVGGGIFFEGPSGVLQLHECTFTGNSATSGGGVRGHQSASTIEDCLFQSNSASLLGGGLASGTASINIFDSQFVDNVSASSGGGLAGGNLVLRCTFDGNSAEHGGGVAIVSQLNNPLFANCEFKNNTATEEGAALAINTNGSARMVNAVVHHNTAPVGMGAVYEGPYNGSLQILSSTIANNDGGGITINNPSSFSTVKNTIVWGNTNGGQFPDELPMHVQHCCVQGGGVPGVGNISDSPGFLGAIVGNYRLSNTSPCIDAGHNWLVPTDFMDVDGDGDDAELFPFDFDGNPRITDNLAVRADGCHPMSAVVDIGPFESAGVAAVEPRLGDTVTSATFQPPADGVVDAADLSVLLGAWGPCEDECCPADLDLSGEVDAWDLALLLGSWG